MSLGWVKMPMMVEVLLWLNMSRPWPTIASREECCYIVLTCINLIDFISIWMVNQGIKNGSLRPHNRIVGNDNIR